MVAFPFVLVVRCSAPIEAFNNHGAAMTIMRVFDNFGEEEDLSWSNYASFLGSLVELRDAPGCQHVFTELVSSVAALLDGRLNETEVRPNLLHLHLIRGGTKRRRIDEDLKLHLASEMTTRRLSHSASQVLRVTSIADPSLGGAMEEQWLKVQLAATHTELPLTGVTSVAEDAARSGNPAEDTCIYLLWDAVANLSAVLPPIALFNAYFGSATWPTAPPPPPPPTN